ncbi:hypothetical protein EIP86_000565 [Pleurotus ostreatoroseus]|nr:hypothetical protein EIP86_000565 [Pleurotus ostreatoroseus]
MSFTIPSKQKALLVPERFAAWAITEIDVPSPGEGEVLVRSEVVGLNPADWGMQKFDFLKLKYPAILGLEAVGTVVKLGEGVTSLAVGDVPANLTIDQAASIPVAFGTATIGLYCPPDNRGGAGLTAPWEEGGRGKYAGKPIVILGGSTSVSQAAIQLAKMSGFSPIITTASLKNAELLKSLGATHVIDRNLSAPEFTSVVHAITKDQIDVIFEGASSDELQVAAYELLASGGVYAGCRGGSGIPEAQRTPDKPVTFVFGSPFWQDRRKLCVGLYKSIPTFFESGEFKPNNVEVIPGGFSGAIIGLQRMEKGEVSAKKLVVHPPETV